MSQTKNSDRWRCFCLSKSRDAATVGLVEADLDVHGADIAGATKMEDGAGEAECQSALDMASEAAAAAEHLCSAGNIREARAKYETILEDLFAAVRVGKLKTSSMTVLPYGLGGDDGAMSLSDEGLVSELRPPKPTFTAGVITKAMERVKQLDRLLEIQIEEESFAGAEAASKATREMFVHEAEDDLCCEQLVELEEWLSSIDCKSMLPALQDLGARLPKDLLHLQPREVSDLIDGLKLLHGRRFLAKMEELRNPTKSLRQSWEDEHSRLQTAIAYFKKLNERKEQEDERCRQEHTHLRGLAEMCAKKGDKAGAMCRIREMLETDQVSHTSRDPYEYDTSPESRHHRATTM
eukprot:COSAG02_NODE_1326_length_13230_cov_13.505217_7_plen_351_part_00